MKRASWLLVLAAALGSLQCGYHLSGSGRSLPAGAATIAIPDFKNETSRPQTEQFVTFAVREEFVRRTRLRLAESPRNADLFLEGAITSFTTSPLSYSASGQANLYEVRLTLDIRLVDMKSGDLVYQGNGLSFQETYETENADFFSQETDSLGKIAAKFASSIVTSILENF